MEKYLFLNSIQKEEQGSLAHFKTEGGNEIHLASETHKEDDILIAAGKAGLKLNLKKDILGNAS